MKRYIGAWLDKSHGQEDEVSKAVTDTLFGACPELIKRRALLVYSIYGRAQAHSGALTDVQIVPPIPDDGQRSPV